jgi:hypothetical protein
MPRLKKTEHTEPQPFQIDPKADYVVCSNHDHGCKPGRHTHLREYRTGTCGSNRHVDCQAVITTLAGKKTVGCKFPCHYKGGKS